MQEQLPQNLLQHIKKFEEVFTVDTAKLKAIVKHFVKELEKGMFPVPSTPIPFQEANNNLGLTVEGGNIVRSRAFRCILHLS
jgi:hypothetical protein